MDDRRCVLAEMSGLGRVYDCGHCGNIHLQIGMVNLTLTPEVYRQLASMITASASNLEVWLQQRGIGGGDETLQSEIVH